MTAGTGKAKAVPTTTPEAAEEYLQKIQILERLAALQSETALLAVRPLTEKLEETNMLRLFDEVEMPLTYVLASMENTGILASREELAKYGASLSARIEELTEDIYEQADEEFNINSPKQLGHILFDVMHMPGGKKTKTGYSTAADVLEKLAPDYPIVAAILEYRTLTKLKSTYADGLAAFIDGDGRIRTSFKQTVTATGRLSSADPNLQNIPMREELGRLIRKCFYPDYRFTGFPRAFGGSHGPDEEKCQSGQFRNRLRHQFVWTQPGAVDLQAGSPGIYQQLF